MAVGESFSVGDLTVEVTSLMPVGIPSRPRFPMTTGVPRPPGAGEAYYQAFARAENGGDAVVRFGPGDFALDADGFLIRAEPTLSGPGERSLLRGASLDLIVTFVGPAGLAPSLVYRTDTGGVVHIEGTSAPEVFDAVPTSWREPGIWVGPWVNGGEVAA